MMERAYKRTALKTIFSESSDASSVPSERDMTEKVRHGAEAVRSFWKGTLRTDLETALAPLELSDGELAAVDRVVQAFHQKAERRHY